MFNLIVYKALTNPCVRFVRVADGLQWNNTTLVLAATPTYAATAIVLTKNAYINGIPITIPAKLPTGDYDMLIYDAASPANTDAVSIGKRIAWNMKSGSLVGLPIDL